MNRWLNVPLTIMDTLNVSRTRLHYLSIKLRRNSSEQRIGNKIKSKKRNQRLQTTCQSKSMNVSRNHNTDLRQATSFQFHINSVNMCVTHKWSANHSLVEREETTWFELSAWIPISDHFFFISISRSVTDSTRLDSMCDISM